MLPFQFTEHTADICLEVFGSNLSELFVHAAQGMMVYLFGDSILDLSAEQYESINIAAPDQETLLVDWLSELLFRASTRYVAYVEFSIDQISSHELRASAGCLKREALEDIKAVTYHNLKIETDSNGMKASIVFDI